MDLASWEDVPEKGTPRYNQFQSALARYQESEEITPDFSERRKPKFKEIQEQPSCLVGGELKNYQIDGLKYVISLLFLVYSFSI
jgi:hypothetical protein